MCHPSIHCVRDFPFWFNHTWYRRGPKPTMSYYFWYISAILLNLFLTLAGWGCCHSQNILFDEMLNILGIVLNYIYRMSVLTFSQSAMCNYFLFHIFRWVSSATSYISAWWGKRSSPFICWIVFWGQMIQYKDSGPWFNIKMTSYQCRKFHCGDKTVVRSSYLHNGISYTGKMSSLYWIRPLLSYQYRDSHIKDKTVMRPSYLH